MANASNDPAAEVQRLSESATALYAKGAWTAALEACLSALDLAERELVADHPLLAQSLDNAATLNDILGEPDVATVFYARALAIYRERGDRLAQATTLANFAFSRMGALAFEDAEVRARECLTLRLSVLPEGDPRVLVARQELACVLAAMGRHDQAYATLRPEQRPLLPTILTERARRLQLEGKLPAARRLYQSAVDTARRELGTRHEQVAQALNNLAALMETQGEYHDAADIYQQSLRILEGGTVPLETAKVTNNLGRVLYEIGDHESADECYVRALRMLSELEPGHLQNIGTILDNRGQLHRAMAKYRSSRDLLQHALAVRRALPGDHATEISDTINNLGLVLCAMHDFAGGVKLFEQALDMARLARPENSLELANILNNVGAAYRNLGLLDAARAVHLEAFSIRANTLGRAHRDVAESLNNLAAISIATGDFAQADELFREAMNIRRLALGPEHPIFAESLANVADVAMRMGNLAEAEQLFEEGLRVARKRLGSGHFLVAVFATSLGHVYGATGRAEVALEMMQESVEVAERLIHELFAISSDAQRLELLARVRGSVDGLISIVFDHFRRDPRAVRLAFEAVLKTKGLTAEAMAVQQESVLGYRYPQFRPALTELASVRARIAERTLAGLGSLSASEHQWLIDELTSRRDELEIELAGRIPEVDLAERTRALDLATVAHALPNDVALVEMVKSTHLEAAALAQPGAPQWTERYLAFVLTGPSPGAAIVGLGEAKLIDGLVAELRAMIDDESGEAGDESVLDEPGGPLRVLGDAVMGPIATVLNERRDLFVAPDGELLLVPLEILRDANGFVIDGYRISYLSTGRDVLRIETSTWEHVGATAPLVIADPDFDLHTRAREAAASNSDDRFESLHGTRREGKRVARMLAVKPWLGAEAKKGRLQAQNSPVVVHLATHGFFRDLEVGSDAATSNDDQPSRLQLLGTVDNPLLRSGLAFAGANAWMEGIEEDSLEGEGILTGEEVTGLDLRATELVVLSACETGLGGVRVGEGVFGLRRAFVVAGANTLIMSLWKVPDKQTEILMVELYRLLKEGRPRRDALRDAQRAVRRRFPNVVNWGGFICQGDPGPLSFFS